MRRILALIALAAGALTAVVGFATAAKPTAGAWSSKHAHFTVNKKMTRVTDYTSKCAGYPLPLNMKVKSGGTFSYRRKVGLMGGTPTLMKVKGTFTSATTAKVTASFGRCHEKFTARTKAPPVQTTPTDTTTPDEPVSLG